MTGVAVSLVVTTFDEAGSIGAWLDSLRAQTRQPDEVVIVDGGSRDGTVEVLERAAAADPRIRIELAPGANISRGRNIAFERARGPVVAVSDAGTELDPQWLERLVAPLEAEPGTGVVSGFFRPGGRTPFGRVLAATITPRIGEVDPGSFLPSSRSLAIRRDWWERAGGYPEWLEACEDLVFDLELRRAGASFAFAPEAIVTWLPGDSLRGFFGQYRRYAHGDGRAGLWPARHAIRYTSYAAGAALLAFGFRAPPAWAGLGAGAALHFSKYLGRVRRERPVRGARGMAGAYALVPVIVVTGDLAKMAGYPAGRLERWRARES